MHPPAWRRLLLVLPLLLLGTSCGAMRFNRAWSDYLPAGEPTGMAGRWDGEWRSEKNGHAGGLRCLMTLEDEAHCRAWFLSTYARVFRFQHETLFRITAEEQGTLRFEGEQDLGKMAGGVYRYEGTVSGDSFRATFQAENGDHGVFEMQRVD